jgi:DNA-binding YbaB/EbfC family protein
MFGNMIGKLKEAEGLMEETKARMESIYVNAEAENGMVKVIMNANKKLKDISIDNSLMNIDEKERLEELLIVALNKAMEKADKIFATEMQGMSKGLFPSFPFLF